MLAESTFTGVTLAAARAARAEELKAARSMPWLSDWLKSHPREVQRDIRWESKAVQELRKRLGAGAGWPGMRLAEAAVMAGIVPPPRFTPLLARHGSRRVTKRDLWTVLARENAGLRRRERKLSARMESVTRRIRRTKVRLQLMRWKLVQKRLAQIEGAVKRAADQPETAPLVAETVRGLRQFAAGDEAPVETAARVEAASEITVPDPGRSAGAGTAMPPPRSPQPPQPEPAPAATGETSPEEGPHEFSDE